METSKIPDMVLQNPTKADFEKMTVETLHKVLNQLGLRIAKSAKKDNIINQILEKWNSLITTKASSASASTNEEKKSMEEKQAMEEA